MMAGSCLKSTTSLLGLAALMATATAAGAQVAAPAPAPGNVASDDIVVTATRRAESISKVPVSMIAANQKKLDALGVKSIDDLTRLTPGVQFAHGAGLSAADSNIAIRGMSSVVGSATTGIYIDDTPIQIRAIGNTLGNPYPRVFDLDRIEALKGPQGTLFGAGAEGGTVRFITPAPSLSRLSAYVRGEGSVTQGGQPSYEGGAAIGAPLIADKLGMRVSAWYRRDGGYIDRIDPRMPAGADKNSNDQTSLVLRGALAMAPTERLTITPSIFYQRTHSYDRSQYLDPKSGSYGYLTNPGDHQLRDLEYLRTPVHDRFALPALKIDYDLGPVELISNTSFFIRNEQDVRDYSFYFSSLFTGSDFAGAANGDPSFAGNRQRNFTQEIRLQSTDDDARLSYVIGAFYANNRQYYAQDSVDNDRSSAFYAAVFGVPLLPGNVAYHERTRARDRQLAGYGELTLKITDKLKAIAGARVARTKFDFSDAKDGPIAGAGGTDTGRQSETPVTPKFSLTYQADANNFFYATAAKGYRIGGANPTVNALCSANLAALGYASAPRQYESDHLWSYEVGSKNSLAGGRIRLDGSAFYINWSNIQQRVTLSQCGGQFIGNLGKATSKGFDLSAQVSLTRALLVSASLSYNDTSFTRSSTTPSGAIVARDGDKIGGSPWSLVASGQYNLPFAESFKPFVRLDYEHHGRGRAQDPLLYGYDPLIPRTPSTDFVSARIGMVVSGWDVSIFGDNLFDTHRWLSQGREPISSVLFYDTSFRPRTVGMTFVKRY